MTGVVQSRKRRTPVPAWMQDKATLEAIARLKLEEAGFEPLSPGTKRLAEFIAQAEADFERRLAAAREVEPPF